MASVIKMFSGNETSMGEPFQVLTGRRMAFSASASGSYIGTVNIEGSLDGIHWFGIIQRLYQYGESNDLVQYVRVNYSDDGAPGTATVLGLQSDED